MYTYQQGPLRKIPVEIPLLRFGFQLGLTFLAMMMLFLLNGEGLLKILHFVLPLSIMNLLAYVISQRSAQWVLR